MQTVLITGSAGFVGYHLSERLLDEGARVTGLDAMTDHYDVALKERRHAMLTQHAGSLPWRPGWRIPACCDLFAPPFRIVNIGNSAPVELTDFIAAIEAATGRQATRKLMDMQPGDVPATWADASLLQALTGYAPRTEIAQGVARFVAWYRDYYGV